ncbi:SPFH domain-containing protein [Sphaerimonospora thailandensis]|uniref:Paraslipin n=1 Tax=Sphaerimonospora thailandensis TaxID=795644 RepID=A0A8J3R6B2_9ACTN|nr:SPFH domain-containing protein [Sphaerimonospora thailandensis]GIH69922.1 paraslipin [Sphaerimonospora thailandensis]
MVDSVLIGGIIVALVVVFTVLRAIRIVPQARAGNVERLGRYYRTLGPGLNFVIPFIDRVHRLIDLREQVVSFQPQPVITEDNLVVDIDTVLYFQVTDPRAAEYEIANFIQGVEQLTVTTLRNVVGGMDLEQTLTSRDTINSQLRGVLDEATGKWGIRVNRVEIKAIDPPRTIKEAMEKQMRAERDKRAAILTAEGQRQSQILTAEGEKQSAILRAEGERTAQILKAEGQSQAIDEVFQAVHRNDPDPKLLAYQYLQVLPQLAQGEGNTFWVIPSEVTSALQGVSKAFTESLPPSPATRERERSEAGSAAVAAAEAAAAEARAAAEDSELGPRQIEARRREADLSGMSGLPGTQRSDALGGDQDPASATRSANRP